MRTALGHLSVHTSLSRVLAAVAAIAVGCYASQSFAGHHFYTADAGEARLVQTQGHQAEGQLGCVYLLDKAPPDAVRFYRAYNPATGDHLYTIDAAEKSNVLKNGWKDEGIVGSIYSQPHPKTIPIYRLYHAGQQDHFMTISPDESFFAAQKGQYKFEGVAGWILTECTRGTTAPLHRFWKP